MTSFANLLFGTLLGAAALLHPASQPLSVPTPHWVEQAGIGVTAPACGSSSINPNPPTCNNGSPVVTFTWTNAGRSPGLEDCLTVWIRAEVAGTGSFFTVAEGLSCSGSYTWNGAAPNTTYNYEIRYRTADLGGFTQTYPLFNGFTGVTDYGHLIGSGQVVTPNCPPPNSAPSITSMGSSHTFFGAHTHNGATVSDIDGNLANYTWSFLLPCPGGTCPSFSVSYPQPIGGAAGVSVPVPGPTFTANTLGNYTLQLVVNDSGGLSTNNFIAESVQAPDLIISAPPSLNSGSLVQNQNVTFVATVKNQGNVVAPISSVRFRVDLNNDGGAPEVTLAPDTNIASINPGLTRNAVSASWTNIPAGTHRIIVCADSGNSIAEGDETNNCNAAGTTVVTVSAAVQADLVPLNNVSTINGSLSPGSPLTFTNQERNNGGVGAAANTVRFCVDGVTCFNQNIPGVGAGNTSAPITAGPWSATIGNHTLNFCVDSGSIVPESNEANNCTATQAFTITNQAPIAQATISSTNLAGSFSNSIIVYQNEPISLWLSGGDPPASSDPDGWANPFGGVAQGGACEWNSNFDTLTANLWNTRVDQVTSSPATPADCKVSLGNVTFTDPPNTYTYDILRIVDNGGAVSAIATVQITVQVRPDLSISQAPSVVGNGTIVQGQSRQFRGRVANAPSTVTAGGTFNNNFYIDLSSDGTIDIATSTFGTQTITTLGSGSNQQVTSNNWTATVGTHRVIFCADSTLVVTESQETNNCAETQISVIPLQADLISVLVPANPTITGSLTKGNTLVFKADVKNNGATNVNNVITSQFNIDVGNDGGPLTRLTPDPTLPRLDSLDQRTVTSGPWTAQEGTHRLIICTNRPNNPGISEYDSSDTSNCTSTIFTISGLPQIKEVAPK